MSRGNKIVVLGEVLYELVPQFGGGELHKVSSFVRNAGGAPANLAIAARKLGGTVRFIGKVGNDPFGQFIQDELSNQFVEAALIFSNQAKTGVTFISLREDGERDFVFCNEPSADMFINTDDIKDEWWQDAGFFHFGSRSLMRQESKLATIDIANKIRSIQGMISFDPNIRIQLWDSPETAKQTVLEHISYTDILKINKEEIEFLFPNKSIEQIAYRIFSLGVKCIIITLGELGCRVVTKKIDIEVPSIIVSALDTTAAGDSFMGAVLYQLQAKKIGPNQLVDILSNATVVGEIFSFSNAAGALATTKYGAISSLPTYSEVAAILKNDRML